MTSPFTKPIFNNPEHIKLLESYLNDRCLEPSDFPEGLVPISDKNLLAELGYNYTLSAGRPFIFLQYLDPYGKPYVDQEGNNPYRLARFLGPVKLWDGKDPPPKVIAQNDRPNVLHFEPLQSIEGEQRDWHSLKDGQIVVHVESMIKARSVGRHTGFPCIGYNGVNSYSSSKRGVELIHKQYDVDFTRLRHVILFDSNVWKPEVAQARLGLMFKLKHVLGCRDIAYVDLPKSLSGEDIGPDDFLAQFGNQPLIDLIKAATNYTGEEHDDLVAELQERAVYCTKTSTIIDRQDKVVRNEQKAASFYAPINKKVLKGKATVTVPGFPLWRESKERTEVLNPAYEYLGSEFIQRDDGSYYNLYRRSGPWPTGLHVPDGGLEGPVEAPSLSNEEGKIVSQLRNMMSEKDLELFRSYLKYLKFSSAKPTSFPVLYSDKRGVGKGWAGKLAYRLIGASNSTNATAKQFVSNFNKQLEAKRLVVANEFKLESHSQKEAAMNSLKTFFGDEFFTIEPKGMDSYQVENRAGMIITCNKLEDVPTDGLEDRRMWYIECSNKRQVEESEWPELHAALDNPNDMNDFTSWVYAGEDINFATWRPPLDAARERAILASSSSVESAVRTVLHDLQEDSENGWICVSYDLVIELVKGEGVKNIDNIAAKTMTTIMKQMGWVSSEKKYGKNGAQKKVWIVDAGKFSKLELHGLEVSKEVARAASYFVGHSKY